MLLPITAVFHVYLGRMAESVVVFSPIHQSRMEILKKGGFHDGMMV